MAKKLYHAEYLHDRCFLPILHDTETEVEKALKASMLLYYSAYSTVALVHTTSTIVSGLV